MPARTHEPHHGQRHADAAAVVSNWIPISHPIGYHSITRYEAEPETRCEQLAMNRTDHFSAIAAGMLRDARYRAGLSLREVARRAGTSHATLHAYESGEKVPSVAVFLRVLDACSFAVDVELSPRIRWQDGIYRGDELEQVLELAAEFPARVSRYMDYPRFGRTGDPG